MLGVSVKRRNELRHGFNQGELEDSYRKFGGTRKLEFDERMMPKVTWQTSGQTLITISERGPLPVLQYTYFIKDDTLTIINFKGGKEVMIKESRRK